MAADGFELSFQRAPAVSARGPIEAVAFNGCFGALHLPDQACARGVTVLLCPPIGRDARCAYRALFDLAQDLAARGFAVLRYDHPGEGDSSPLPPEVDHWPLWMEGIERAAAFARAHGGGTRLVLGGLRIGATLAAQAAQRVAPDAMMLLAPLPTGRSWSRELQMAASFARAPRTTDGSIELDGLHLNRATLESLHACDLRGLPAPTMPVFLATPAPDERLAAALGPHLRQAPFAGYAQLFREAHLNERPTELFEKTAAWLLELPAGIAFPAPIPPPAVVTGEHWVEQAVIFGPGLRGVLTLPAGDCGRSAVIFGNTGADPRYGIGSFAAQAGRALAAEGVAALRFDFAGFGLSDARAPGEWRPHIYQTTRADDFRAAADLLSQRGFDDMTLAGVCAGGHHALQAAIADARFRRVLAINSFLVWRPLLSLAAAATSGATRRRARLSALVKPSAWRKFVSGQVSAGEALELLLTAMHRRFAPRRIDAACEDLRNGVLAVARRGGRVRVIVGRDDDSFDALEADFGPSGAWLAQRRGVDVSIQSDLDHGLFSPLARLRMIDELRAFVRLPVGGSERVEGAARPCKLQVALSPT